MAESHLIESIREAEQHLIEEMHEIETTEGGMPQLNPDSFASQLFWLTIVFAVLYLLMARTVIPRIRDVLEKRQNQIQHDLDVAESAKNEAEAAKATYEAEVAKAKDKTAQLLAETQREIDEMVSTEQAKLSSKLQSMVQESETSIAQQRKEANENLASVLQDVTGQLVETFTKVKPSPDKVNQTIAKQSKA